MAKKSKFGGRHASVGGERFINSAARDALVTLGGARIQFGAVIRKSAKSHPRGSWAFRKVCPTDGGGVMIILYGDSCAVEACVLLPANDNKPAK